jgi:hypothetical protein
MPEQRIGGASQGADERIDPPPPRSTCAMLFMAGANAQKKVRATELVKAFLSTLKDSK